MKSLRYVSIGRAPGMKSLRMHGQGIPDEQWIGELSTKLKHRHKSKLYGPKARRDFAKSHMRSKYTLEQIRRMYIKRQHERFVLRRKYPEIDWDGPRRDSIRSYLMDRERKRAGG